MRLLIRNFHSFLTGFLLTGFLPLCLSSAQPDATLLESIEMYPSLDGDTLEIRFDHPFTFVTYTLKEPDRLVIDPVDPIVHSALPETQELGGTLIQGWKVFHPAGDPKTNVLDYMAFELSEPSEHLIEWARGRVLVRVRRKDQPYPFVLRPVASLDSGIPPPPEIGPAPSGPLWLLEEALAFGLNRHRPIQIARDEVRLAEMKVREARRALYPAAKLKLSWTEGTASEVNFTEYQTGLQMEHPLYYSGRLMETYRQSLVNLQVAEKRKAKVKSDFSLEIAEAYYQFVGANGSLEAQRGLVEEAQRFFDQATQRYGDELLTRLELLNVEAQLNQARFQLVNSENDVALARLKFFQKLGLMPDALVQVPSAFAAPEGKPIDLEEAMDLGLRYRPDIQVGTLLVQFHEFEERIQRAKGKLQVDLSGFIGTSAAAFETEPLDAGDDYFVGIKAKRSWGPHGMEVSMTDTKTSPRLGQTTRTDSLVYSAELGILDKLEGLSEVQQAKINLGKARRDLEEGKANVFQEVQEAFISYNKARLQLDYAWQKIQFREEQVNIFKAQASVNEALPSQVLEAIMKVVEERVGQVQALSHYFVALAKLNKAVGLTGHYE